MPPSKSKTVPKTEASTTVPVVVTPPVVAAPPVEVVTPAVVEDASDLSTEFTNAMTKMTGLRQQLSAVMLDVRTLQKRVDRKSVV
jgi:hypothetical protein